MHCLSLIGSEELAYGYGQLFLVEKFPPLSVKYAS
jgi:hypothetical protein